MIKRASDWEGIPLPLPKFQLKDHRPKIRMWLIEDTTQSKWLFLSSRPTYLTQLPRDIRALIALHL